MAVTGSESHKSKKSKHKKSPSKTVINNSISGRAPEEDDSETDLDKPLFKLPQHHRTVSKSQTANGDISDSETDVDKPPKRTEFRKSGQEIHNAKTDNYPQSAMQRSDEDEESDNEQQSMSLLQLQPAKVFSEKRSNQSNVNRSPKSGHNTLPASGPLKSKVIRKPNVPEMSPSESDSDKETNQYHHSQLQRPQSQPESESEEESEEEKRTPKTSQINHGTRTVPQPESESGSEDEEEQPNEQSEESRNRHHQQPQQQFVSNVDPFVRIKEEVQSNSESSSFEEDDPSPLQEFQNTSLVPSEESRRISSQSASTPQNLRGNEVNRNHSSDIATFEQEHTRISAPVIDIPQDSRVWVLQVPRSIEAIHLHGQYLPKKLKGGEVLNLPSGRWQIMEQPYEASRSTLNCIVSTGNFSYGMRWLQPRGFWFLKHLRNPLQMETTDAPWAQEVTPLPIKELLKMKSNAAISKDQHLKPSKKRHRNSDLDLPSKPTKTIPEGVGMIHQLFVERKRKVQLFNNSSSIVDIEPSMMELSSKKDESMHKKMKHNHGTSAEQESSIQGGEAEKGKKRKRSSEVNEESPNKKKKKHSSEVYDQSHLKDAMPQSHSISVDDVNRSMTSAKAEHISGSKKEKKSKHKEICDESLKRLSYPVTVTKVKQEITENDSEWMEHSPLHNVSGSPSDKKHRRHKKKHVEQEVEDSFLETRQNESRETSVREKKKKGKRRSNESEQEETFQAYEKKIEVASPPNYSMGTEKPIKKEKKHSQQSETSFENTDTEVRKKKKHKHHKNRGEGEVPVQETKEEISVKKKKKHKHKESDVPKVKQENFWERETSPDFLNHLYLTQATAEDK